MNQVFFIKMKFFFKNNLEEKYEEADNLYRELLKKDPTNTVMN